MQGRYYFVFPRTSNVVKPALTTVVTYRLSIITIDFFDSFENVGALFYSWIMVHWNSQPRVLNLLRKFGFFSTIHYRCNSLERLNRARTGGGTRSGPARSIDTVEIREYRKNFRIEAVQKFHRLFFEILCRGIRRKKNRLWHRARHNFSEK